MSTGQDPHRHDSHHPERQAMPVWITLVNQILLPVQVSLSQESATDPVLPGMQFGLDGHR